MHSVPPRPRLHTGGGFRRTYLCLRSHPDFQDPGVRWKEFPSLVQWETLNRPHGRIPFQSTLIDWILTVFIDVHLAKEEVVSGGCGYKVDRGHVTLDAQVAKHYVCSISEREKMRDRVIAKQASDWDPQLNHGNLPLGLPLDHASGRKVTSELIRAQLQEPWAKGLIFALREQLSSGSKAAGAARWTQKHQLSYLDRMRLSPHTEVLEYKYISKVATYWVPYMPNVQCQFADAGITWRYWVFIQIHCTMAGGFHRAKHATITLGVRMCWWPRMSHDIESWWLECPHCAKNRGKALKGISTSVSLDGAECNRDLPWMHVEIDVEGPFSPTGEGGARHVLTYRCKTIRASLLEPFTRMTRPLFARAFLKCMWRSGNPISVGSDRGPEMRNAIIRELTALLGIDKTLGLPYQPTFQAPIERDHLESKLTLTCILGDLAASRPAEWEFLVPAVEYLKMITPYSKESGLCPRDLDHGWSLASDMNRDLIPFHSPSCECKSEFAANLFANFLQLKLTFDRYMTREAEQRVAEANRGSHSHDFKVGEIVYRQPIGKRDKRTHTLGPRGTGPFKVRRVISPQTVELEAMDGSQVFPSQFLRINLLCEIGVPRSSCLRRNVLVVIPT